MKRMPGLVLTLTAIAALLGCGPSGGGAELDPAELLARVDAATKAVTMVRYEVTSTPSGSAENFSTAAAGESVLAGWIEDYGIPERFFAHVTTTRRGTDEAVELTGGGNGETFYLIDHATRLAYEDMDPGVMGSSGRLLQGFGMLEFVHHAPFDDEINADSVELEGIEDVEGVECYRVHVVYAGGQGESTWFFGTEDYLPRGRIRHFNNPGQGEGAIELRIRNLDVDPDLEGALFTMKLPEGYEQVDDFAP